MPGGGTQVRVDEGTRLSGLMAAIVVTVVLALVVAACSGDDSVDIAAPADEADRPAAEQVSESEPTPTPSPTPSPTELARACLVAPGCIEELVTLPDGVELSPGLQLAAVVEGSCFVAYRRVGAGGLTELNDFVFADPTRAQSNRLGVGPDPEFSQVFDELAASCAAPVVSSEPVVVSLGATGETDFSRPQQIDRHEPSGGEQRHVVRVFEGAGFSTVPDLLGPQNGCGNAFWTATWRSLSDEVLVQAAPVFNTTDEQRIENLIDGTPVSDPATSGYLSGSICSQPGFLFGGSETPSTLVDVVLNYQLWLPVP
jgi:hypothetical protein